MPTQNSNFFFDRATYILMAQAGLHMLIDRLCKPIIKDFIQRSGVNNDAVADNMAELATICMAGIAGKIFEQSGFREISAKDLLQDGAMHFTTENYFIKPLGSLLGKYSDEVQGSVISGLITKIPNTVRDATPFATEYMSHILADLVQHQVFEQDYATDRVLPSPKLSYNLTSSAVAIATHIGVGKAYKAGISNYLTSCGTDEETANNMAELLTVFCASVVGKVTSDIVTNGEVSMSVDSMRKSLKDSMLHFSIENLFTVPTTFLVGKFSDNLQPDVISGVAPEASKMLQQIMPTVQEVATHAFTDFYQYRLFSTQGASAEQLDGKISQKTI